MCLNLFMLFVFLLVNVYTNLNMFLYVRYIVDRITPRRLIRFFRFVFFFLSSPSLYIFLSTIVGKIMNTTHLRPFSVPARART